jgi:hypothetical protein
MSYHMVSTTKNLEYYLFKMSQKYIGEHTTEDPTPHSSSLQNSLEKKLLQSGFEHDV